ncbi:helix-turn-helix domain-containing protein [Streptomyces sp. NPDC059785]
MARQLRVTADTVRKWRRRFLAERLEGPADQTNEPYVWRARPAGPYRPPR